MLELPVLLTGNVIEHTCTCICFVNGTAIFFNSTFSSIHVPTATTSSGVARHGLRPSAGIDSGRVSCVVHGKFYPPVIIDIATNYLASLRSVVQVPARALFFFFAVLKYM